MKKEIATHNVVVRKATESGGRMWTPVLPPKLDPESKPNLGDCASDSERVSHSEFALQTEICES